MWLHDVWGFLTDNVAAYFWQFLANVFQLMAMHIEILAHFGVVPYFKLEKLIVNPLTLKLYISGLSRRVSSLKFFFLNSQVWKTMSQLSKSNVNCCFCSWNPTTEKYSPSIWHFTWDPPKLIAEACGATILMRSKSFKPQISGTRD